MNRFLFQATALLLTGLMASQADGQSHEDQIKELNLPELEQHLIDIDNELKQTGDKDFYLTMNKRNLLKEVHHLYEQVSILKLDYV